MELFGISCKMILDAGLHSSGIYTIYPEGFGADGLCVYCDMVTDGGGWIVFQRRQDGSVDFYRNWTEYQSGFGDLSGEFWLGNDNLVTLTQGTWELRVDLGDWEGNTSWAKYSDFQISPGEYNLNIGRYDDKGTAGNALKYHNGCSFSTKDRDTDSCGSCNHAQSCSGAWWFKNCCDSHLNGPYYTNGYTSIWCKAVYWWHWKKTSYYSLKTCSMKMRETARKQY
ncbi:ficolin-2-like isoform X3 [Acanthaster planci]|uniref:Ficolin-2-like isoform X3 n=1 Tax=Acanthaster planci TaxID=133434 RepID=A0A8B7ZKR2_ACAPL|nr:ficolin-2-like isoform X3 [Acanthaster planci]